MRQDYHPQGLLPPTGAPARHHTCAKALLVVSAFIPSCTTSYIWVKAGYFFMESVETTRRLDSGTCHFSE